MASKLLALALLVATTTLATPASAGPKDLVICIPGGAGSSGAATTYMAPFFKRIETLAGWPNGSIQGSYQPDYASCTSQLGSRKPGFAVVSLGVYLEQRSAFGMQVIGQVDMFAGAGSHLYLVVKKGSYASLDALKGKKLVSNHVEESKFVSRVVFGGKIDVERHFVVKKTSSNLQGMREVARGAADATIVNADELKTMKQRSWGADLVVLHTSPALPPAPLVALGRWASAADIAKVKGVFTSVCSGADGRQLCASSSIQQISPATDATYAAMVRLYGR
jgi:ABC-type phosphate/phosphonate transport system substrate-binding protein